MNTVRFGGEDCTIEVAKYQHGEVPRLQLYCQEGPMATATINIEGMRPAPGHVFIKDYAENEGMVTALQAAGLAVAVNNVDDGIVHMCVIDPELAAMLPNQPEVEI